MDSGTMAIAMNEFKKEQEKRKVASIKNDFRKVVNLFGDIKVANIKIKEIFTKMGFALSEDFKCFLQNVDKYEDLIFISVNGHIGIGTSSADEKLHIMDFAKKTIT